MIVESLLMIMMLVWVAVEREVVGNLWMMWSAQDTDGGTLNHCVSPVLRKLSTVSAGTVGSSEPKTVLSKNRLIASYVPFFLEPVLHSDMASSVSLTVMAAVMGVVSDFGPDFNASSLPTLTHTRTHSPTHSPHHHLHPHTHLQLCTLCIRILSFQWWTPPPVAPHG